ncbi:MAG: HesA/MoeB/ThiF family protein [Planctomycetes bacterium]|nr:HesA/MoeB/ThiF family protein [Planctomycetota bacterium]
MAPVHDPKQPPRPEDHARYARNLGTLGRKGQAKLLSSRIVIVGLGGLGGHALEQMARVGIGHITAMDPDVFDPSNLNRQLLSDVEALGVAKVDRAEQRIQKICPETEFLGLKQRHTEAPDAVWTQADLVFDCLDNIADRLSLAEMCGRAHCPLIHGAIAGWVGQVAVVQPGSGLLNRLYPDTGPGLEKELGTPPFTAALCASLMVAEGVKVLCDMPQDSPDRVAYVDLQCGAFWSVDMSV